MLKKLDFFFERRKEYGAFFLRAIIGLRLVVGTQDNVLSWSRMLEFRDFLHHYNMPLPLAAAVISVYAQFICGILYLAGAYTRIAAVVMIVNFIAALIIVHLHQTFLESFDALMMLFSSVFFLFYGAGQISIDHGIRKKKGDVY